MKCPHCGKEMDEDLAQKGFCSKCEKEFNPNDLEEESAKVSLRDLVL